MIKELLQTIQAKNFNSVENSDFFYTNNDEVKLTFSLCVLERVGSGDWQCRVTKTKFLVKKSLNRYCYHRKVLGCNLGAFCSQWQ